MIIDTHLHPTNLVDEAWRHTGTPFNGERMLKLMDGPYMINGRPRRIDMGFIQPPPAFAMIASRAGRHQVVPDVSAAQVARNNVVNCQGCALPAAILAGIIIAAKHFAAC